MRIVGRDAGVYLMLLTGKALGAESAAANVPRPMHYMALDRGTTRRIRSSP